MQQLAEQFSKLELTATGFIHSPDFFHHNSGHKDHPEKPRRTQCIDSTIKKYLKEYDLTNVELNSSFTICTKEDILLVHPQDYFDFVESQFDAIEGQTMPEVMYISDTYTNKSTANTARKCVQGVLTAVDKVMSGQWRNAFCSVRPPGHHAGHKSRPNGFCIYNNIAIAARYAQKKFQITKVLIFDWDVHHCDGTEAVFYDDPNVLVISIHRYDQGRFYPRSGDPEKVGQGNGKFKNINVGWNIDYNDPDPSDDSLPGQDDYIYAYERLLGPVIAEFKPELILISAGYDSAKGDPLGGIENTPEGYQFITAELMKQCGKVIAVLEGGYNIEVTANCSLATFKILSGEPLPKFNRNKPKQVGINAVTTTVDKHKEHWQCLVAPELLEMERKIMGKAGEIITGGHMQAFEISGPRLIKRAKRPEVIFYRTLLDEKNPFLRENKQIVKFLPRVYEVDTETDKIIMENLAHNLDSASIIDLKIGFLTYNPNGSKLKKEKELKKAKVCEQDKLGFRVAGLKVRDASDNLIINKNGSIAYTTINTEALVKESIISVLCSNGGELNRAALEATKGLVKDIIDFISTSKRFFRNTSILLIVDNKANSFQVKWIDMNYVQPLKMDPENPNAQYDTNLEGGMKGLLGILKQI